VEENADKDGKTKARFMRRITAMETLKCTIRVMESTVVHLTLKLEKKQSQQIPNMMVGRSKYYDGNGKVSSLVSQI